MLSLEAVANRQERETAIAFGHIVKYGAIASWVAVVVVGAYTQMTGAYTHSIWALAQRAVVCAIAE